MRMASGCWPRAPLRFSQLNMVAARYPRWARPRRCAGRELPSGEGESVDGGTGGGGGEGRELKVERGEEEEYRALMVDGRR